VWVLCVVRCHCFNVSCSAAVVGVAVAWLVVGGICGVFVYMLTWWFLLEFFLGVLRNGVWVCLKP